MCIVRPIEKKLEGVAARLRAAANGPIDQILRSEVNYHRNIVSTVTRCLQDIAGPRDALSFLVDQIEREPRWFAMQNNDGWAAHSSELGELRGAAAAGSDLERRVLAIVLAELRRDLESQQSRNRDIYYDPSSGDFWNEKVADFALTAEDVYRERRRLAAAVAYIANYLYYGLDRYDRAIEIMWIAQRQGIFSDDQTSLLVGMLHDRSRYAESIPLLTALVERRPDYLNYRIQLMTAYYQTKQPQNLLATLDAADAHWHENGQWEGAIAALGGGCLGTELYERCTAYYEEAISLRQRSRNDGGEGDATLSNYYRNMGVAYGRLGDTPKAVEAASGAIVSWGRNVSNRNNAFSDLERVLRESPDLDAYVAYLDKQTEESGLENPIVRKALGKVYLDRKQYGLAAKQYENAVAAEPDDMETQDALIAAYDGLGDEAAANRQRLAAIDLDPRAIDRYRNLGDRMKGNTSEEERAYTSIVEALPLEAESHALLADVRQTQKRWDEAIDQWRSVAELRSLEPTGLLKIAEAQVNLGRWDNAEKTVDELASKTWPERFNNIASQIRQLRQEIDRGRR